MLIYLQISPVLTEHVRDYVHHILIHLCPQELSEAAIGVSAPCSQSVKEIQDCQAGLIFGGWAIGGEVIDCCAVFLPFISNISAVSDRELCIMNVVNMNSV